MKQLANKLLPEKIMASLQERAIMPNKRGMIIKSISPLVILIK